MNEFLFLAAEADVRAKRCFAFRLGINELAVEPDFQAVAVVNHHRHFARTLTMQGGLRETELIGRILKNIEQTHPVQLRRAPAVVVWLLLDVEPLPVLAVAGKFFRVKFLYRIRDRKRSAHRPVVNETIFDRLAFDRRLLSRASHPGNNAFGNSPPLHRRIGGGI